MRWGCMPRETAGGLGGPRAIRLPATTSWHSAASRNQGLCRQPPQQPGVPDSLWSHTVGQVSLLHPRLPCWELKGCSLRPQLPSCPRSDHVSRPGASSEVPPCHLHLLGVPWPPLSSCPSLSTSSSGPGMPWPQDKIKLLTLVSTVCAGNTSLLFRTLSLP